MSTPSIWLSRTGSTRNKNMRAVGLGAPCPKAILLHLTYAEIRNESSEWVVCNFWASAGDCT